MISLGRGGPVRLVFHEQRKKILHFLLARANK